ncbi:hypothetical protein GJAV_G00130230 [Gymnothorax javanicus]|nr:hypothetical protein GJAV_G00130230 [Gymnothorax javanicus]
MDGVLPSMEMEEEANINIPRGRGENGLLGQMYKDEARPENPQKRFMPNRTEEHGALLGPLGNPQSLELNVGSIMSSAMSSDNCIGNTAVDHIIDYWMMGLDHVSKIDKTGVNKDYSHELKNDLVRQESQPTKPEATFTSITGLPNQVRSFTESDQMKTGSAELGNLRLEGSDLDQFVQSKETLIGNVSQHGFKHGNEKYLKSFDQDLSESPYSTSVGSISALSDPNFEMESRELKREPQVIKADDVTWSEGMGLPHFDVWRDSLKDDRKYASNEDVKPDCSDSKQSIKAMPIENNCAFQVKLKSPKLKYESLNDWTNGEDVIWSEGVRLLQDQFYANFNCDIHQHVGDKDEKTDHPGEILCIPQSKNVDIKIKVEPNDLEEKAAQPSVTCGIKNEEEMASMKFKTEGENIPKLMDRKTEMKIELCQIDLDCQSEWKRQLDAKQGSGCPVLKDEDEQDAFHGKHQSKVNAAYLKVKKEDPALNLDYIKESYSDVPPDSKFFSDPNGASRNLPTLPQISNTELVSNEEKNLPCKFVAVQ